MDRQNKILWVLQWIFGIYFVAVGVMHFIVPEGLPGPMSWMYDLSDNLHMLAGTAEILGGLGLILPGLTKIVPKLTVFAALGLTIVMLGAIVWHVGREEAQQMGLNVVMIIALLYIAYGRWKLSPLPGKQAESAP